MADSLISDIEKVAEQFSAIGFKEEAQVLYAKSMELKKEEHNNT